MAPEPPDLERFVAAQDAGGTFDRALSELRAGRKTSHWMWFVFPQVAGLGRSATARRFALADAGEARAYLHHPVLGPRLREATQALLGLRDGTATQDVLGDVDALKLRSSMTLFLRASDDDPSPFAAVLERYYAGEPDPATDELLGR